MVPGLWPEKAGRMQVAPDLKEKCLQSPPCGAGDVQGWPPSVSGTIVTQMQSYTPWIGVCGSVQAFVWHRRGVVGSEPSAQRSLNSTVEITSVTVPLSRVALAFVIWIRLHKSQPWLICPFKEILIVAITRCSCLDGAQLF